MTNPRHLAVPETAPAVVNPLHPKLKAGAAGLLSGSAIGAGIDLILTRFHWYTAGDSITRTIVLALLVAGCGQLGHLIAAYWAKWEPEADTIVSKVTHAVLPDAIANQIDEKFKVYSDEIVQKLEEMLGGVHTMEQTVSTGTMASGGEVSTGNEDKVPPELDNSYILPARVAQQLDPPPPFIPEETAPDSTTSSENSSDLTPVEDESRLQG